MYLSQCHLVLAFVSNCLKRSFLIYVVFIIIDLGRIFVQLGVEAAGSGIRVQNYMFGVNFDHANGGHCCTFGNIFRRKLTTCTIVGFVVHIDWGHCSSFYTMVVREQIVERE